MGFIDSLFPAGKSSDSPLYTLDDAKHFAQPFINKAGIQEAFAFGELAKCGSSQVVSVAFVVSDMDFRSFATMVAGRLLELRSPTVFDRRNARSSAFVAKWSKHTNLKSSELFLSDELNLYVLPLGWRADLSFPERIRDLKRKLHEESNGKFVTELQNIWVVPT
jgi:hypothetical protein